MDLRIRAWQTANGCAVLELHGELEVYTSPKLREHIVKLVNEGHYELVVDLEDVDYMDSTGLGVLVGGLKRVRAHDGSLRLVCAQERVLKIFRITGLVKVFPIFASVEQAVDPAAFQRELERLVAKETEVTGNWLDIRIYISNRRQSRAIEQAVNNFAKNFGIDVIHDSPPIIGSWFREKLAHARQDGTLADQLKLAERALQMKALLKTQAEIDRSQADATALLIATLEKTSDAIVQVGSILIVKHQGTLVVRNLTQRELAFYERNPSLFRDPAAALKELQRAETEAEVTDINSHPGPVIAVNGSAIPQLCVCGSGLTVDKCQSHSNSAAAS